MAGGGWPVGFGSESFSVRVRGGVLWGYLGGGGYILEKFIDVVEMRNQLQPESNLGSPVVVPYSRFETNVKVELVFGVVLGPCYFFKAIRFGVDELCILWHGLVWIPERGGIRSIINQFLGSQTISNNFSCSHPNSDTYIHNKQQEFGSKRTKDCQTIK